MRNQIHLQHLSQLIHSSYFGCGTVYLKKVIVTRVNWSTGVTLFLIQEVTLRINGDSRGKPHPNETSNNCNNHFSRCGWTTDDFRYESQKCGQQIQILPRILPSSGLTSPAMTVTKMKVTSKSIFKRNFILQTLQVF